jgi:predicted acyltransferase
MVPLLTAAGDDDVMTAERLRSLDIFRGLTIAGMILVNSPGNETAYQPLDHAPWDGLTPTDLVFPFFMFIVGLSLVFSLRRRVQGVSPGTLLPVVVRRAAILFGLGLLLNGFPYYHLSTIRIPGVLQRIALGYLIGSLLYLWTSTRTQLILGFSILVGYWLAMTRIFVPGFGAGILTKEGNLAAYVDRMILHGHMYRPVYDPEGILSTFPAMVSVLFGVWVANYAITTDKTTSLKKLLSWGFFAYCAGLLWEQQFPLNKALWSSSFVLVTAGFALLVFAGLYACVEIRGWKDWGKPFEALGQNAIAAYMLHILFLKIQNLIHMPRPDGSMGNLRFFITDHLFRPLLPSPEAASFAYALCYTLLWISVFWFLSRRRIAIKI